MKVMTSSGEMCDGEGLQQQMARVMGTRGIGEEVLDMMMLGFTSGSETATNAIERPGISVPNGGLAVRQLNKDDKRAS